MSNLIKKFIKTPDVVEAFEWNGKSETLKDPEIALFMANNPHFTGELGVIYIHTLEGEIREAKPGDYIVKGLRGEIFPVAKRIFSESYSEVHEISPVKQPKIGEPADIPTVFVPEEEEMKKTYLPPTVTVIDMETMEPIEIETEEPKPVETVKKKEPKPKKAKAEAGGRYQDDLNHLVERFGGPLEDLRGETIEIELQDLNTICPRDFVKAKSYMGLVGFLKRTYEIELKITSQRSK